jgi:hypothetical protein
MDNMQKQLEAVRAGLAAINKRPAAFLFLDNYEDWTWDLPEILGIPVFHGVDLQCLHWSLFSYECLFIPVGVTDDEITSKERKAFADAYEDAILKMEEQNG